jgi:hypothetical protein
MVRRVVTLLSVLAGLVFLMVDGVLERYWWDIRVGRGLSGMCWTVPRMMGYLLPNRHVFWG